MSLKNLQYDASSYLRRNALTITATIIAFCIICIFILQALTISSLSEQVKAQNNVLDQIKKIAVQQNEIATAQSQKIDGVDKHLDCIVLFFSQRNRDANYIKDINQCRISSNQSFTQESTSSPAQSSSKAQKSPKSRPKSTPPKSTPTPPANQNKGLGGAIGNLLDNILGIPRVKL